MRHLTLLILIAAALLTACVTFPESTPRPRPTPDYTQSNAEWTPVVQEFNGVEMVKVPAGCFMMGNENGRRDERPVTQICFDEPYWIDRTEVTNAQYGQPGNFQGDNRPRENLLWTEARDFCAGRGARLPTEAEWEYAARGPDSLMYPWGDYLIEENLIFDRNYNGQTWDVGSRPGGVSWVGALDMSGNVYEWVSSLYRRYPYDPDDGREDLDAPGLRVFRSGQGSYIDYGVSSAIRFWGEPDMRDWFIGFRCAKDD
jgi:formylglycine-generating enzyme required for sulfatase activity